MGQQTQPNILSLPSNFQKKKDEPTSWTEPSLAGRKLTTVQEIGLDSGHTSSKPSQARGEPKKTRAELKARPVRPAFVGLTSLILDFLALSHCPAPLYINLL
jgi:hypothetical protein